MPGGIVTHQRIDDFQEQYGTVWNAVVFYLDGKMPREQMVAFEMVIEPGFLVAVAMTRAMQAMQAMMASR